MKAVSRKVVCTSWFAVLLFWVPAVEVNDHASLKANLTRELRSIRLKHYRDIPQAMKLIGDCCWCFPWGLDEVGLAQDWIGGQT
jgi:spore maturation protein SpmA